MKPLLQVALDHKNIEDAMLSADILKDHVDILEAGTILLASEGAQAIQKLKSLVPHMALLADYKVADAGEVIAEIAFSKGATLMTVICSAPLATVETALKCARQHNGDIQIELYGHWTFDNVKDWLSLGVTQTVYHRGRDAQASGQNWGENDFKTIATLCDIGAEVSVTGGLTPSDLYLFKNFPVKAFISGRALYGVENPAQASQEFRSVINELW